MKIEKHDVLVAMTPDGDTFVIDDLMFYLLKESDFDEENIEDPKMTLDPSDPSDIKTMAEIQEKLKSLDLLEK
jgi:hypothetical protein